MQDPTEELLERIAQRLKAMGNSTRLRILHNLERGELSVSEIQEAVDGSQANTSKQLAVLRSAGLVTARRDGMNVFYRVEDEIVFRICHAVCDSLLDRAESEVASMERARDVLLTVRT